MGWYDCPNYINCGYYYLEMQHVLITFVVLALERGNGDQQVGSLRHRVSRVFFYHNFVALFCEEVAKLSVLLLGRSIWGQRRFNRHHSHRRWNYTAGVDGCLSSACNRANPWYGCLKLCWELERCWSLEGSMRLRRYWWLLPDHQTRKFRDVYRLRVCSSLLQYHLQPRSRKILRNSFFILDHPTHNELAWGARRLWSYEIRYQQLQWVEFLFGLLPAKPSEGNTGATCESRDITLI